MEQSFHPPLGGSRACRTPGIGLESAVRGFTASTYEIGLNYVPFGFDRKPKESGRPRPDNPAENPLGLGQR